MASGLSARVRDELDVREEDDERVADELFEEDLDNLLRDEEDFHQIADALMDEIEKRFDILPLGKLQKTRQGWPLAWCGEWPFEKRNDFVRAILGIPAELEHGIRRKWNVDSGGSGTSIPGSGTRIPGSGTSIPAEVEPRFRGS